MGGLQKFVHRFIEHRRYNNINLLGNSLGGHVALVHAEAARICKALRANGVVPDYRPPNLIRLAPVPLYNTFVQCFDAVMILRGILESRSFEEIDAGRELVP